ncbi:MAG: hypothetical protein CR966_01055 [Pseudomonadales bacterium]|nr:MAG: hypothetical protein CR966_01055 [Pseudomonadales bacterium]
MSKDTHIRFDWAIKYILRDKANFDIVAGFLSELLHEDIIIEEVLDSESNADNPLSKVNRVDLLVRNSKDELIIIEVQNSHELDYLYRILFGVSKVISEHIQLGEPYSKVKKVISVNVIYFELGQGEDYLYKGITEFTGVHNHDKLQLSKRQQSVFDKELVSEIFPEIYLIKINNFNDITTDTLDEWIYFFKNSEIKNEFKAKGIQQAKEKWRVVELAEEERKQYNRYVEQLRFENSVAEGDRQSAFYDGEQVGLEKGIEIGLEKGMEKGELAKAITIAKNLKEMGLDIQAIITATGLTPAEIENLPI